MKEFEKHPEFATIYCVTTEIGNLPNCQIFMVDGTTPGWKPKKGDHHWDHHRANGAATQIMEMPEIPQEGTLLKQYETSDLQAICTTKLDSDAVIAAAWLQLTRKEAKKYWWVTPDGKVSALDQPEPDNAEMFSTRQLLEAAAHDCDHLMVPESLSFLSRFAANFVAGVKQESDSLPPQMGLLAFECRPTKQVFSYGDRVEWNGDIYSVTNIQFKGRETLLTLRDLEQPVPSFDCGFPKDRAWSAFQSRLFRDISFEIATKALLAAIRGERDWPGTDGVQEYWENVNRQIQIVIDNDLIDISQEITIFDQRPFEQESVDPRVFSWAYMQLFPDWQERSPITLTAYKRKAGGVGYTIGSLAAHPKWADLDYSRDSVYEELTDWERRKFVTLGLLNLDYPEQLSPQWYEVQTLCFEVDMAQARKRFAYSNTIFEPEGWNGRRSVGGSGWNTPSLLTPTEVVIAISRLATKQPDETL